MSLVRELRPLRRVSTWIATGALAGLALWHSGILLRPAAPVSGKQELARALGWAVGGATSMAVYWAAFGRSLKVDQLPGQTPTG